MAFQRIFSLNVHASYRCQHSGACCAAGWAIPVEPARQALLGASVLLPDDQGVCHFYDRPSGLCRVHRDHGADMLPEACHQFPRRARIDDRGTFLTLSHFCPTAAALLVGWDLPLAVVASPPAFPSGRRYEGLDARGAWPPLVKPDLMFDLDAYDQWERFLVDTLAAEPHSTTPALQWIAVVAERLRRWQPESGPLARWLESECRREASELETAAAWRIYAHLTKIEAYERLLTTIPEGLPAPTVTDTLKRRCAAPGAASSLPAGLVSRYVAAKAFASWSAYDAFGVRTMVAELVLAELVLRVEEGRASEGLADPAGDSVAVVAVRAADWLLVHLIDRPSMMAWLGGVESPGRPRRGL